MSTFTPWDWLYLSAALVLLLLSAIFAASEIGILSVNRFRVHQLAEEGAPRAQLLEQMLRDYSSILTTILVLITSLNFINESLVTFWLHGVHGLPEWIPFVGLLVLVLIFGEVTPISYAAANPEIVATGMAPFVAGACRVLRPVLMVITGISSGVLRLFGIKIQPKPLVTSEDVRMIIDIEAERGVLEEEEKELINSIFEFSDTIVREIMVPRIDIVACSEAQTVADAIEIFATEHYSRLPVYQTSLDLIIGQVNAKDLLPYQFSRQTNISIRQAMRPVIFVPETKRVSELLREFRETKQTLAIVLDEYGGTAGLVTIEDLLEEIVGEIYDEYDVEERAPIEWLDEHTVVVDGKLPLDEVDELLHFAMPRGEYDTIGGFLYSRFGDVPARGERVTVDGFDFIVDRLDGHRITKVRIILPMELEGE